MTILSDVIGWIILLGFATAIAMLWRRNFPLQLDRRRIAQKYERAQTNAREIDYDDVIRIYGAFIEKRRPTALVIEDEAQLPFSKGVITESLLKGYQVTASITMREQLRIGGMVLAYFQSGVGDIAFDPFGLRSPRQGATVVS